MRLVIAAAALACTPAAFAGELYGSLGLPGASIGWAQPISPAFTVRADYTTIGDRTSDQTEEGIAYRAKLKANRTALFADWYPMQGSFRLTAGLTANDYKLNLTATGAGGTLTIGSTTYTTTAADRFDVLVKMPSTTPYLGLGWGHQSGSGLRFAADLGVMVGKAKLSTQLSGPLAGNVSQSDIDQETAELRDGVAKIRVIPQIGFSIGYSF